jgi:hypothetical protein
VALPLAGATSLDHPLYVETGNTLWHIDPLLTDRKPPRALIGEVFASAIPGITIEVEVEDQLSLVSLDWMMVEAIANGLVLDSNAVDQLGSTIRALE